MAAKKKEPKLVTLYSSGGVKVKVNEENVEQLVAGGFTKTKPKQEA